MRIRSLRPKAFESVCRSEEAMCAQMDIQFDLIEGIFLRSKGNFQIIEVSLVICGIGVRTHPL